MSLTGRLTPYELPFVTPYRTATAHHATRRGVLVHLRDGDHHGIGEAAPLSNRTEDHATSRAVLTKALDKLAGLDPERALAELDERVPLVTTAPAARAGIATALVDLLARREGMPLAAWLAEASTGATPATSVPVNATLPYEETAESVATAREHVADGFTTLKIKVGRERDRDVALVEALREELGPAVDLRLDANQAWAPMEAIEILGELEHLDIEYVEQPTPQDDHKALALVRQASRIPIGADEPVTGLAPTQDLLALEAADVYILKPMVLGGPDRALRLAREIEAAGHDVVITSTIDAAVGRAMALHVAAALGERGLACGLATANLLAEDVIDHDEGIQAGRMRVPDVPGLGLPTEGWT